MKYLANSILNRKLSASPRPVVNGASPSRTTTYNSSCSKSCQVVDPWSAYDYAIKGLDLSAHALSYDISSMCYRKMKQRIMRATSSIGLVVMTSVLCTEDRGFDTLMEQFDFRTLLRQFWPNSIKFAYLTEIWTSFKTGLNKSRTWVIGSMRCRIRTYESIVSASGFEPTSA